MTVYFKGMCFSSVPELNWMVRSAVSVAKRRRRLKVEIKVREKLDVALWALFAVIAVLLGSSLCRGIICAQPVTACSRAVVYCCDRLTVILTPELINTVYFQWQPNALKRPL